MESAMNVGATIGSLSSIFLTDVCSRRGSFYLSAGVLITFWIFLETLGFDQVFIIFAAGLAGFAVGIYSATSILYIAETSSPKNRGIVGAAMILFVYLGVFMVNLFAYLMDIKMLLKAMAIPPIIFVIAIYAWMIESPYYLFQRGMVLESKISLKNLRDRNTVLEIDKEYRSMVAFFNSRFFKKPKQLMLESLCPNGLRPLTLIILPILCMSQMIGITAISDYAQILIRNAYKLLADNKILPMTILCTYYAIYALGFIPVFPIVAGEIFPCRAKTAAVGMCWYVASVLHVFLHRKFLQGVERSYKYVPSIYLLYNIRIHRFALCYYSDARNQG
ncbi:sugar transport protein 5 isoform X2 [Nasonia vitripennis]|uniref:Major facilitator superfamily (MFS) profile domain-containing protein n=1 Tax=Nasonia vitripennis TaxID=7425 RepID=A0A7M7Q4E2_NASVI|nr:sugar transport protein 5 isoform X2 [Nasonia vitripennis]XP_032452559.1 sugar transport protein 5 isoform X2 [Nasonia vitripennis]